MSDLERTRAYVARESAVSVVINAVLSLGFFLLIFRMQSLIPVWGLGNYVFDFAPQSFMVSLMSILVPGMLARRKLRAGGLVPLAAGSRLPQSLPLRASLVALIAAGLGVALASALFASAGAEQLGWMPALMGKIIYGGILGGIVTRLSLPAALAA